jgi:hypothetical protein
MCLQFTPIHLDASTSLDLEKFFIYSVPELLKFIGRSDPPANLFSNEVPGLERKYIIINIPRMGYLMLDHLRGIILYSKYKNTGLTTSNIC